MAVWHFYNDEQLMKYLESGPIEVERDGIVSTDEWKLIALEQEGRVRSDYLGRTVFLGLFGPKLIR